jgi:hypothetical protein
MTGLASLILYSLLITQESPSRQSRDCFVFSFALENKLSALLKRQNPQLSLRASCFVDLAGRISNLFFRDIKLIANLVS